MSAFMIVGSLIAATAQYLIFLIPVAAAVIWLYLPRQDKVGLAAQAVVSMVIAVVLIKLAGATGRAGLSVRMGHALADMKASDPPCLIQGARCRR
ncbi:MAG: hypothetical protein ACYDC9_14195 [Dermatophilaceae bacterium]